MKTNVIHNTDCLTGLKELPDNSIDCIVTSPPYWALRDYGVEGQLGLENTFQDYIDKLLEIFTECKRVLKENGSCWINLGDTYSGSNGRIKKEVYLNNTGHGAGKTDLQDKSLCMIPERFAIAMIESGWILRNQIIWHKPSCMPSSVKDRFTVDFEKVFFFTKNQKYYFKQQFEPHKTENLEYEMNKSSKWGNKKAHTNKKNVEEYRENTRGYYEQGRNKRTVWSVNTQPFSESHFAVYPEKLIETPIIAGCPVDGIVLDPFMGAGTTALVALKNKRQFIGFELNPEYIEITQKRIKDDLEQQWLF